MRVKNAFRILAGDAGVIFKSVFFRLIVTSIIALVGYFVIVPPLQKTLFSTPEASALGESFVGLFTNPLNWTNENLALLLDKFDAFMVVLGKHMPTIYSTIIWAVLFVFILNIIYRMGNFAVGNLYDGYMSAQTKFSLMSVLFANFGKSLLYSVIVVPIVLLYDALVLLIGGAFVYFTTRYIFVFAIIWALIFIICALSLKFTILSNFLPNIVTEKQSVGKAFVNTFKNRKNFITLLGNYAFLIMIAFYLNVSVCVFTVGVGLFVSIPLTVDFTLLISFVDYYNTKGKKFYVDEGTIVVPKQLDKNADLLKYM